MAEIYAWVMGIFLEYWPLFEAILCRRPEQLSRVLFCKRYFNNFMVIKLIRVHKYNRYGQRTSHEGSLIFPYSIVEGTEKLTISDPLIQTSEPST